MAIALHDMPPLNAAITGHVRDATGAPIADALVRSRTTRIALAEQTTTFATTGIDGAFTLDGLDRGGYDLAVQAEGYATARLEGIRGGSADVTVTLDQGQQLAGQVVDATGAPVPSFTLLVYRRDDDARSSALVRSMIDPRGRFAVRVPPGDHHVVVSAPGWAPSDPVHVPARSADVRIVLRAGSTLRGVVVASDNDQPIAHARIRLNAIRGGATIRPANAGAVTGPDGTFELAGLPAGVVILAIEADGYHAKIDAGTQAIDGGALGPLRFELTRVAGGERRKLEQVGIGAQLAPDGPTLRVDYLWPDGSARAAGLQVGDHVAAIDGRPIEPIAPDGTIPALHGSAGTTMALTVLRGGTTRVLVVPRRMFRK
jgi:hypothetical protein